MKKSITICAVLGSILFLVPVTKAAEFDGVADNERDDLGYYYVITGGQFPTGNIPNGNNGSGGTFRFLNDDPGWGYPINVWNKDDWFPENASLALTMMFEDSIVYDNNGIETDTTDEFYHEDTNPNLAGLYRGYAMSNNYDWIYAGYFKLEEETIIDTIIGYFDAASAVDPGPPQIVYPFDPDHPHIAYRMNIWSSFQDNPTGNPNSYMPMVASFTGDEFSTDSSAGSFSWSDTGIDRYYSGWPSPHTDDILRLVFVLDEPITLSVGEYFFSHDAIIRIIVDIDIKPGIDPNWINTKSNGVVSVAILGSDTFDVNDVDVDTLFFGPDKEAQPVHNGHLEDVNDDGFTDLVSHYRQKATGIAFGDTEACLTAYLIGGGSIIGCDSVNVVK